MAGKSCYPTGSILTLPEVNLGLPGAYDSPADLPERADRALYAAKHAGKNCVKIAPADCDDQAGQAPG